MALTLSNRGDQFHKGHCREKVSKREGALQHFASPSPLRELLEFGIDGVIIKPCGRCGVWGICHWKGSCVLTGTVPSNPCQTHQESPDLLHRLLEPSI
jgi:hypothetical protein